MSKNEKRKVALFTQMITLLAFCCTFFLNTQNVMAAREPYYVDYMEPSHGDDSGYIVLEYEGGAVATLFWSAYSESVYINDVESVSSGCSIVVDENRVVLTILTDSNIEAGITNLNTHYTFSLFSSSGTCRLVKSGTVVDSNPTYTYTTNANIVGYYCNGNVSMVTHQLDGNNSSPVVIFGNDLVGQYVSDLYLLIAQNKNTFETYLPKLNKIEAWESRNNEQLELLVSTTNDILKAMQDLNVYSPSNLELLSNISNYLSNIDVNVELMLDTVSTLLTVTNSINSRLDDIYWQIEDTHDYIVRYMHFLDLINEKCSTISVRLSYVRDDISSMRGTVENIEKQLEILSSATDSDKQKNDAFAEDSSSQADNLNELNQQTQTDKPNIENMSNKVDENLNVDIDANYGLLLSAFTSNNRILTMLLMVASVSLISYVLFGKR